MSESNLAVVLAPEKAHWVDSAHLGLLPDSTIVREWRNVPLQSRQEAVTEIRNRRLETDPKAQTKAYSGIYRILKVEDIVTKDKSTNIEYLAIREHLSLGLAQSLAEAQQFIRYLNEEQVPGVGETWPISPAHPAGTSDIQSDSRTVVLRWVAIDPAKIEAIYAEQNVVEASSLSIYGETKTGPWFLIQRGDKQESDGSITYDETWSLAETVFESLDFSGDASITANRFIQGVPKNRVKEVLQSEITALGTNYQKTGITHSQKVFWKGNTADILCDTVEYKDQSITAPADLVHVGNMESTPRFYSLTQIVDNATTPPTFIGNTNYGRVSYRKNGTGLYSGERTVTVYRDTITIPGWALTEEVTYVRHPLRTTYKGQGYIRYLAYKNTTIQTNSAHDAVQHTMGGLVGTEAGNSRYEPLANGQYRAIRIELSDSANPDYQTTAWERDYDGDFPTA